MAIQLRREAAPLRAQAVAVLKQQIVSGGYRPGQRLVEKRLEEDLGVSRTVIREALRQLESQQLITMKPQVGPIVAVLTVEDARHLYQVRGALEGAAARLAAENADDGDVARLRDLIDRFREAGEAGHVEDLVAIKDDFYAALVAAAGNPVIEEMLGNVQARIALLRAYTLEVPGRSAQSHAELSAVIDAIEAHHPELAESRSREHVLAAQTIALTHFAEAPPVAETTTATTPEATS
ncbi:GntR family transcriptional regulator [Georgenia halophila]|uniref:GntR family transcriptional regulator n=1 Tax=Georgenia halophila TaxID=620889 RepID=A0ABP8KTL9_9MICO